MSQQGPCYADTKYQDKGENFIASIHSHKYKIKVAIEVGKISPPSYGIQNRTGLPRISATNARILYYFLQRLYLAGLNFQLIKTSIHNFLKAIQGKKILVIGDLMLDRYLWGKVNRISPEAPVPIAEIYEEENRLGGAANVALNLHAMGAKPILCGYVGEDEQGADLIRLVHRHGFPTELILLSTGRRTTVKVRVIGNQQQVLRVDKEDKFDLSEKELDRMQKKLLDQITRCDAILFQDYDKGLLVPELINWVMKKAVEENVPVAVDPKFKHFFDYSSCTLFKPNLKELNQGLNYRLSAADLGPIHASVVELRNRMPHTNTLITLGPNGMYLVDGENQAEHFPAHERAIADVSGAGDTVISVATLGLAAGIPLRDAVYFANLAGGLVCEEVGVVFIDPEKLIVAANSVKG